MKSDSRKQCLLLVCILYSGAGSAGDSERVVAGNEVLGECLKKGLHFLRGFYIMKEQIVLLKKSSFDFGIPERRCMAKQDIASNTYLQDAARMADLLNAIVYDGKPVIRPGDIREITPVVPRTWWTGENLEAEVRIADAGCRVVTSWWTAVVFFQNQTDISYIMPVRGMDLETAEYYNQWKSIGTQHEKDKDLQPGGEYLSRFAKQDCLEGTLTIVLYYGREKWDGARRLKELLPEALRKDKLQDFIADYPVNIFEVRNDPNLGRFRSDLRQVFGFLQKDSDKKQLRQYVQDNRAFFDNIPEDAYDLLTAMSHIKVLRERKARYRNERSGNYMLCQTWEDWAREEREDAQEQISILGIRMKADNRIDDFFRCLSDLNYRRKMLQEYGLVSK